MFKRIFENYKAATKKWSTFKGRSTRSEFGSLWLGGISILLLAAISFLIGSILLGLIIYLASSNNHQFGMAFASLMGLAISMFYIFGYMSIIFHAIAITSAAVRRLHDLGHPGWWILLVWLIPLAQIYLLIPKGETGKNKYGPDPRATKEN
ncbi:MAG: DUF805 domain-containing protein [Cytophagales bacterium]